MALDFSILQRPQVNPLAQALDQFNQGQQLGQRQQQINIQREQQDNANTEFEAKMLAVKAQQQRAAAFKKEGMRDLIEGGPLTPEKMTKFQLENAQTLEQFSKIREQIVGEIKDADKRSAIALYNFVKGGDIKGGRALLQRKLDIAINDKNKIGEVVAKSNLVAFDANPLATSIANLAAIPGVTKEFSENQAMRFEAELQPDKKREAKGLADVAETQGKVAIEFGRSKAVQEAALRGAKTKSLLADISIRREQNRVNRINTQLRREENAIKADRLRFDLNNAMRKRDDAVKDRVAKGIAAVSFATEAKAIIKTFFDESGEPTPALREAVGRSFLLGFAPGTKARTAHGNVNRLESLFASTKLDDLKGAMSDKDIIFLKQINANLDKAQNEEDFVNEIRRIDKFMDVLKARKKKQFGITFGDLNPTGSEESNTALDGVIANPR